MGEKHYEDADVVVPECMKIAVYVNQAGNMTIMQIDPYSPDECFVVIPKAFVKQFAKKVSSVANSIGRGDL